MITYFQQLFDNKIIFASIISWAIAQHIKIVLDIIAIKKINWKLIFSSGGMPSSHSAFVSSLATMIGIDKGFDSDVFAVSFVIAFIVMYDAAGVRRAAGYHAVMINKLNKHLNIMNESELKELLGHTPIQVIIGAIIGIFVAILSSKLLK